MTIFKREKFYLHELSVLWCVSIVIAGVIDVTGNMSAVESVDA